MFVTRVAHVCVWGGNLGVSTVPIHICVSQCVTVVGYINADVVIVVAFLFASDVTETVEKREENPQENARSNGHDRTEK